MNPYPPLVRPFRSDLQVHQPADIIKGEPVTMPPKKKGNKKGADDWEAELGEQAAPTNGAAEDAPAGGDAPAEEEEETGGGGGLMSLMRKNKEKRKKKGLSEDFVQGEDPAAPAEANAEDEFALPEKKGKGKAAAKTADNDDVGGEDTGRVKTKAEKEREKKEREKQRKKEQVCFISMCLAHPTILAHSAE